jgi:hypothetical protein
VGGDTGVNQIRRNLLGEGRRRTESMGADWKPAGSTDTGSDRKPVDSTDTGTDRTAG